MKKLFQKIVRRRHDRHRHKKVRKTANLKKLLITYNDIKKYSFFCLFYIQNYLVCKLLKFGGPIIILSASN
jgi:hypothetical protein